MLGPRNARIVTRCLRFVDSAGIRLWLLRPFAYRVQGPDHVPSSRPGPSDTGPFQSLSKGCASCVRNSRHVNHRYICKVAVNEIGKLDQILTPTVT